MSYDLLIRKGRVLDGSGAPWRSVDLAIEKGRIARIGRLARAKAERVIDASSRFVSPGFIDIHTHSDLALVVSPRGENIVRQGVTTEVTGNCGSSPAPASDAHLDLLQRYWDRLSSEVNWTWRSFGQYLEVLDRQGLGLNIAPLVGHGTIRMAVMGYEEGRPTSAQLRAMKGHVAEAMRSGACGLSTGLVYPPGCFANTEEIVELAKVAARYGGFYASHIRGEREMIVEAVREAIEIGERASCPVQISHNAPKYGGWGKTKETLPLIEAARERGIEVTVDNDVHTDFGPRLSHALPQWLSKFPTEELIRRLEDPQQRAAIKEETLRDARPAFGPAGLLIHGRWDRITLLRCPKNPDLVGKTIAALAEERGKDPFEAYLDLLIEEQDEAVAIFDYIDEAEIRALLQHPLVMISSDGWALPESGPSVTPPPYAPCCYGEYPGVLERYVRDWKVLRLEEAIRKMTSFPAQKLGLQDRGLIRKGFWADLVIFDLARVKDRATDLYPHRPPFENYPHRYPEGIDFVLVNGTIIVEDGRHAGALPGRVLRGRAG